jgi:hypothetical protein
MQLKIINFPNLSVYELLKQQLYVQINVQNLSNVGVYELLRHMNY